MVGGKKKETKKVMALHVTVKPERGNFVCVRVCLFVAGAAAGVGVSVSVGLGLGLGVLKNVQPGMSTRKQQLLLLLVLLWAIHGGRAGRAGRARGGRLVPRRLDHFVNLLTPLASLSWIEHMGYTDVLKCMNYYG